MTTAMKIKTPAPAVRWLVETGRIGEKESILDFGAGFGRNTDYLRKLGHSVYSYDPVHGRTESGWTGTSNRMPDIADFDIILTVFVLNVLKPEEEREVRAELDLWRCSITETFHVVRNNDLLKDHSLFQALEGFKTSRGFQRYVTGEAIKTAPSWRIL